MSVKPHKDNIFKTQFRISIIWNIVIIYTTCSKIIHLIYWIYLQLKTLAKGYLIKEMLKCQSNHTKTTYFNKGKVSCLTLLFFIKRLIIWNFTEFCVVFLWIHVLQTHYHCTCTLTCTLNKSRGLYEQVEVEVWG